MKRKKDFWTFARNFAKRNRWFIGGFLGDLQDAWDEKNKRLGRTRLRQPATGEQKRKGRG